MHSDECALFLFGGVEMAGSIRELGNNRWELRISQGYDSNHKQRRITKTIQATSRRQAQKTLDELSYSLLKKPKDLGDNKITFGQFVKLWDERHNSKLSIATSTRDRTLLENRIMPAFYGVKLKKVTAEMIIEFINNLKAPTENVNTGKSLSATSIYAHYKLINHILNKAVEWGYLATNPCNDIPKDERPRPGYQRHPIWNEKELEQFLCFLKEMKDTPTNIKHILMFYIALLTGTRRGELSGLTWDCIDYEEKSIYVNKALQFASGRNRSLDKTKTKESVRKLYVDDYIMGLFQQHKLYQEQYLKKYGYKNPKQYVFLAVRKSGDVLMPISASCLYTWLSKVTRENGFSHITVHSLRHMAATYALNCGAPLTTVQTMLGHTNIRTTSIYLHATDEKRKEVAVVLSNNLQKLRGENK